MKMYLFCKTCNKKVKAEETKNVSKPKNGSTIIHKKCGEQNTFIQGEF